jgi:ABC-type antimicrobial peptide transport system permease subunit
VIGLAGGAAVAVALARLANSTISVMPPIALRPYVVSLAIVAVATATAAFLPSLRTARIDPSKALRVE